MAIKRSNVENFDRKVEIIIKFPNNSICRHKNLIGNRDFRIFENLATQLLTLTQLTSVNRKSIYQRILFFYINSKHQFKLLNQCKTFLLIYGNKINFYKLLVFSEELLTLEYFQNLAGNFKMFGGKQKNDNVEGLVF